MGVESFFINAKMHKKTSIAQLKRFLISDNYVVTPYVKKYGWLFSKKVVSNCDIVINNLVVITTNFDEISFQACFSCYDDAVKIISEIVKKMNDQNIIQYLFYGKNTFGANDDVSKIINELSNERRIYFYNNYTIKKINLLPNEFYSYYRKNRKLFRNNK